MILRSAKKWAKTTAGDDRISKLPDEIITHILSFLPTKDVVQTCILSKRWKHIWYSVPTLFFSENATTCDIEKFYEFVDNCLKHRKQYMIESSIFTFKLNLNGYRISYFEDGYHTTRKNHFVDKWLAFVVENNVKEFDLSMLEHVGPYKRFYGLSKILDNAKYLTILKLSGVVLDASSCSFSFPSLKTLSLVDVLQSNASKDDVVVKFLLGCPSLENLCVCDYDFSSVDYQPRLQSLSLKFLEFKDIEIMSALRVETVNLESFEFEDIRVNLDKIDLSACKKIRNLTLSGMIYAFPSKKFELLISNIPLLENLTLSFQTYTEFTKGLRISSQHLKCFKFKSSNIGIMKGVTIESAPKLEYFCYEGYINFNISLESSNSLNGKIVILETEKNYDAKWFTNMRNFLMNLNCSWNIVTLHVRKCEALMWPENLKNICPYPLLNWKKLRVITDRKPKPKRESDFKDALMNLPCLETLSINGKKIF
ncbi:F-box protein At4g09920-like [Cannabis sativa]|uniref:F-box protein At4g09920-like n=1 Tax=Cannabis sativa TaxID=3483 RepID=UPI0029CA6122|nr:F-box protein At4g09920-like [Cannabis sativa]XP_060965771.1 F-box protein At4g09920-like [Cannabis sativa]